MSPRQVVRSITLWPADQSGTPVDALLSYTAADPYVVRLAFVSREFRETAVYEFDRQLLADGLYGPAGHADVMVGPHGHGGAWLVLVLRQVDAYPFTVYLARSVAIEFVAQVLRLVPLGAEVVDVDAAIERILEVAS